MPKETTGHVADRQQQSSANKRATLEMFKEKPRAEREVTLKLNGSDATMLFRAIGSTEYDKLISKNPPTVDQKAAGSSYNVDTFGPTILSRVCIEPGLSAEEWTEIWNSDNWNRGEIIQLFFVATELCNRGFDIPFTENG